MKSRLAQWICNLRQPPVARRHLGRSHRPPPMRPPRRRRVTRLLPGPVSTRTAIRRLRRARKDRFSATRYCNSWRRRGAKHRRGRGPQQPPLAGPFCLSSLALWGGGDVNQREIPRHDRLAVSRSNSTTLSGSRHHLYYFDGLSAASVGTPAAGDPWSGTVMRTLVRRLCKP